MDAISLSVAHGDSEHLKRLSEFISYEALVYVNSLSARNTRNVNRPGSWLATDWVVGNVGTSSVLRSAPNNTLTVEYSGHKRGRKIEYHRIGNLRGHMLPLGTCARWKTSPKCAKTRM